MVANPVDFLHIWWFFIAGDEHVDECNASPDHESDREDVVLVEDGVELHVLELQADDHVDLSFVGVGGEGGNAQLNHAHRRYQHQDHVEEEGVEPSLPLTHGVKTADAGNAHAELDCALLNAPNEIDAQVEEEPSCQEACVAVVEPN